MWNACFTGKSISKAITCQKKLATEVNFPYQPHATVLFCNVLKGRQCTPFQTQGATHKQYVRTKIQQHGYVIDPFQPVMYLTFPPEWYIHYKHFIFEECKYNLFNQKNNHKLECSRDFHVRRNTLTPIDHKSQK